MTRKKEKGYITSTCLAIILTIFMFGMAGCATTGDRPKVSVEKTALMSYESMGIALNTAKPIMKTLCESETLSKDDCVTAKEAYNQAVKIYHELSILATQVIDTGNDVDYQKGILELMRLITVISTYTGGM